MEGEPVTARGEFWFHLLLLILFGAAFALAFGWPATARRYPLAISGAGICVSGFLLAASARRPKPPRRQKRMLSGTGVRILPENISEPSANGSDASMIVWFAAFGAAILLLGFWLTTAVFIPLFLRCYGRERWGPIALYCLIAGASMFTAFHAALHLNLFGGAVAFLW
jgi:hypothetical protein